MRSRHTSPTRLLLLIIAALLCASATARADEEDQYEPDEYDETARVVRVSLMRGEVSLRRAGNIEWEPARLNIPLVEGDTLATGRDARVEIQFDAYNFVRVGEQSVLSVVTLREEGAALSISEGTATLRLARFDRAREYFELDAPKSTVSAETKGLYRVDVGRDGDVRVTVRDDGRARVYSETSGFLLRSGRTARLAYDTFADGDWEISQAAAFDDWDAWNDERERHLAVLLRYENRERYYDADIYGAEELDTYGDWVHQEPYGWVWRPRASVVSQYPDWAPYRHGHWAWCPPYGWTWVPDEPWGWAPYHYGRWVYVNDNWCWVPRAYGRRHGRAWWRPALVVFVKIVLRTGRHLGRHPGTHIAWYPLGYGHRDPHSRNYRRGRHDRHERRPLDPVRGSEAANIIRRNPELMRAVTILREQEFGTQRARPAPTDLAQRAMTGEPVQGRLPIRPADLERLDARGEGGRGPTVPARTVGAGGRADGDSSREGLTIIRPARVAPPRDIPRR
ncbi:MAG TPA: DUF6600 domain-containing protein, partial [Pyrinomonadaceae bacterium]|nr:DUF6600 domain-containing protein [Pyrinomonadaceae bacterium]